MITPTVEERVRNAILLEARLQKLAADELRSMPPRYTAEQISKRARECRERIERRKHG